MKASIIALCLTLSLVSFATAKEVNLSEQSISRGALKNYIPDVISFEKRRSEVEPSSHKRKGGKGKGRGGKHGGKHGGKGKGHGGKRGGKGHGKSKSGGLGGLGGGLPGLSSLGGITKLAGGGLPVGL